LQYQVGIPIPLFNRHTLWPYPTFQNHVQVLEILTYLVCWMCHCCTKVCALEEIQKEKCMWISEPSDIVGTW
jgi:hypothetical protein